MTTPLKMIFENNCLETRDKLTVFMLFYPMMSEGVNKDKTIGDGEGVF